MPAEPTADRADTARPPQTRDALLAALLNAKPSGLTLDELATRLGVSRNAVRQHVTSLERDGLVSAQGTRPTGRRPSRTYGLTEQGGEAFPRRYDLLSTTMLQALVSRLGDDAAEEVLDAMVEELAARWLPALEPLAPAERRAAVVEVMNRLGYHASSGADGGRVEAVNCVYHKVARQTRAVCRFDERLLSRLLGEQVQLTSCMAEGEGSCVFAALARS